VRRGVRHALGRERQQGIALGLATCGAPAQLRGDIRCAVAQLDRQHRVPMHLVERLFPPLPPPIDGQGKAFTLERLDQQVGDRLLLRLAVEELRIGRGDHHRRMRVIPMDFVCQPQPVVARHHHVDDRQVVLPGSQRRQRFGGVRRGLRAETQR
jgi:hypothetical protein